MSLIIALKSSGFEFFVLLPDGRGYFDDDEEGRGDDQEGDYRVDEGTPIDDGGEVVGILVSVEGIETEKGILPANELGAGDREVFYAVLGGIFDDLIVQIGRREHLSDDAPLGIVRSGENRDEAVDATRDRPSHDRHQDFDDRVNDRVEGAADDDANRHIEDVATGDELFKVRP